MTAIIALLTRLVLFAQPFVHATAPAEVRTTVADGSVWADVMRDGEVRFTERLCDADARTRWLSADVDGDGNMDLISFGMEGLSSHIDVWHQGVHGFVHGVASPRQLVRPLLHALHETVELLLSIALPAA